MRVKDGLSAFKVKDYLNQLLQYVQLSTEIHNNPNKRGTAAANSPPTAASDLTAAVVRSFSTFTGRAEDEKKIDVLGAHTVLIRYGKKSYLNPFLAQKVLNILIPTLTS